MQALSNALLVGTKLNKAYTIDGQIGEGGFGITYRATFREIIRIKRSLGELSQELEKTIAIKEFFMARNGCVRDTGDHKTVHVQGKRQDVDLFIKYRSKFIEEAKILASLKEVPHIVKVIDYFEENETAYMVMEFIKGKSLLACCKAGKVSKPKAIRYISQVAESLVAVHAKGYIHRDVKPENIMINEADEGDINRFWRSP